MARWNLPDNDKKKKEKNIKMLLSFNALEKRGIR